METWADFWCFTSKKYHFVFFWWWKVNKRKVRESLKIGVIQLFFSWNANFHFPPKDLKPQMFFNIFEFVPTLSLHERLTMFAQMFKLYIDEGVLMKYLNERNAVWRYKNEIFFFYLLSRANSSWTKQTCMQKLQH